MQATNMPNLQEICKKHARNAKKNEEYAENMQKK